MGLLFFALTQHTQLQLVLVVAVGLYQIRMAATAEIQVLQLHLDLLT
jgi:hypothetical protein